MKDELGEHGELGYYHAYLRLKERLVDLIRVNRCVSVCDVGGGRSPLFSLDGSQYGSEGRLRQPTAEAWSIRVRAARATAGRVSSAR